MRISEDDMSDEELKEYIKKLSKTLIIEDMEDENEEFYLETTYMESDEVIKDESTKSPSYDMWDRSVNQYFPITTQNHVKKFPSGIYGIGYSHNRNDYYAILNTYIKEEYIELPDSASSKVIVEIDRFMKRKDKFREYDMTFKRGILLYGPPGCGKSVTLKEITDLMLHRYDAIVVDLALCTSNNVNISNVTNFIKTKIRSIEPNRPIVILIEDIDSYIKRHGNEAEIINLLDGFGTIDNVVYLATTNNPEDLHERVINRPNRFDMRVFVDYPTPEERKNFILGKLTEEDAKIYDVDQWVEDTEHFSISHLGELIKLVAVFGNDYKESIEHIQKMNEERPHSNQFKNKASNKSIGLGNRT